MAPYLTCAKVQEYFQPKIKENPSDLELLKRASAILSSAKCEDADFFIKVAEMIYAIEPSSESALSIARAHYANKNVDKAISFYEKGVGGMKAGNDKSEVYLRMANIMYKQGKYAQAKNYATSAIDNDVNNGSAYLIIAQYYGNSASSCTADNLDGRSVFWAAVDKCVQAKSVAPSVSNEANQLIAVYVSKYPKKEDAFFKGFTQDEGSSYTVPCLGVSTTVRFKN
jgi:tetratricopeptide (TPR) repeat protein